MNRPPASSPFDVVRSPLSLISPGVVKEACCAAGDWLLEAARAAAEAGSGVSYRDLLLFRDGSHKWYYPHANMGEQIDTHLDLWEATGEERFKQGAIGYAERMLADREKGIYQGEEEGARGLVYYWRETGGYTGMYSMRAVASMHRLAKATGQARFEEASRLIAEPLLREFNKAGIPKHFAWVVGEGFLAESPGQRVGSRVGYLLGTYAVCATVLGDERGLDGWQKMKETLLKVQLESGAFPQDFTFDGVAVDRSIKNHFSGYLLNGFCTSMELLPGDAEVISMATRLADFSKKQVDYFGGMPYCGSSENGNATDRAALFHPVTDPAPGFLRLAQMLGRPDYQRCAEQIWVQHLMRQIVCPENPTIHGSLPTTVDPLMPACPSLLTYGGVGVPHLEENPERVATCASYFVNQFIQAGCLLLKQSPC